MTTYSELAQKTESTRVCAVECGALAAYWDAVGDYAAQVDAGRITMQKAMRQVFRAVDAATLRAA